ncbi:MAG: STAS domain-containing protein [Burkholderiales bacterium]
MLRTVFRAPWAWLHREVTVSSRHGPAILEGTPTMSASFQDIGADLRRIMVSGRLDMEGTDSVSARLMELIAEPKKGVVVDLSAVRFLASVGIRVLVASAKAVQQRGGKLAIVVASGSTVAMSLEATGVDELIPVFTDNRDAEEAVLS